MKDLAGLEFKKIEDFEFGLRQLKASGVTAYSFVTYISRNDQHTIGVMLSINAEVKKLMEEANLTAEGWRDWDEQHFSGPYTFYSRRHRPQPLQQQLIQSLTNSRR
jgi:hypothetical protein